jgi:predicted anti-sigma-YlaC factor YlaD
MMHLTNEQHIDYMHGALGPQQDAAAYEHMETCESCRKEYDAELALTDMLRAQAIREERELPPMLKAQIWSRIRAEQPSAWDRLRSWLRPSIAVPAAAAFALAAYFGTSYLGSQPGPTIEAGYYLQDHAALNNTMPFGDHNAAPAELMNSTSVDNQQSAVPVAPAEYTADVSQ